MAGYQNLPAPPILEAKLFPLTRFLQNATAVVNLIMKGKTNNFGSVTLTANSSTTTLNDVNIGGASTIKFSPRTENAAASLPTLYYDAPGNQTVTLHHANNAYTDKTYDYSITG